MVPSIGRSKPISNMERIFSPDGWDSMIILPTQRCERISLKNVIEPGRNRVLSVNESGPVRRNDARRPRGGGPVSRESPRVLTMARRPTNFEKDKNKKWSCSRSRERKRTEKGERSPPSSSFFYLLLPTSAACLPVVRPTVRLLFSSLLPFIRVEWLMGSRRHRGILPLHLSLDPTLWSYCSTPSLSSTRRIVVWVFCFSSRQIIAPPLAQHGDCTTLVHTFSVPSLYHINIAALWNGAIKSERKVWQKINLIFDPTDRNKSLKT